MAGTLDRIEGTGFRAGWRTPPRSRTRSRKLSRTSLELQMMPPVRPRNSLTVAICVLACVGLPAVSAQCPVGAAYLELGSPQSFCGVASSVLTYSASGGPEGNGHVSFVKQEGDYLDGGSISLNIANTGGLTIVALVRFTGTASMWETIVQLGASSSTGLIVLARWTQTNEL